MASKNVIHENETAPRKGSRKKLFVILGGAVLLTGALVAFFLWLRAYTYVHPIDLNNYVKVVFEGYDGAGDARVAVDEEAFLRDFAGKLRWKDRKDREMGDPAEALLREIRVRIAEDASGSYSNGDDLRIRWRNKSFAKRIANADVSADSFHVEAEGLKEPELFDAFVSLEVVFEGLNGEGRAVKCVEHSGLKYKYNLDYQIVRAANGTTTVPLHGPGEDVTGEDVTGENLWDGYLSNGDTVTVSIGGIEKERELIRNYGMKPIAMEQDFTVEGLIEYTLFDPFADLHLIFSGQNGEGILSDVRNDSPLEAARKLGFTFSPSKGLSNGDKVTVNVLFGPVKREKMAEEYGMLPDSLEKTFIVSGLSEDGGESEPPEEDQKEDDMENVFGKVNGNQYTNEYFKLKAALPSGFTLYGHGQIPSSVIGGLNDLYAEAGQQENIGVRIQELTEEEKTKSAREILEAYAQEIFAVYKENGAKTSHSYSEVTFAGETYTCLDITASIFIVVKIRHRIFIRKQGEYAVAVSVMAGSDSKLERYVNCFEKLN